MINKMKKKIGIMGGSFDPVHNGHLHLAEDALKEAQLDYVIMIPAAIQPFKQDVKATDGIHRLNMLKLATCGHEGLVISEYEMDHEGVSYTYLTMRAMQRQEEEKHPEGVMLYFITGTDAFLKVDTWREGKELLQNYGFIVGSRPGYRQDELVRYIDKIREEYGTRVINLGDWQPDISSTNVRERLQRGQSITGLVPADVERYIEENELYI